ncbi:GNAT family N-acetyltransferase [Methylocaldum sp.]|uniref:GNAT family N-acetyltransferase n=1 Tax=Methylocaldum sp. TaxID=1969727 RepID=UPI002D6C7D75|nr:GNAT family N-acetyltransferase [Methylocaldum sp.]HYE36248.1 GNAT family N-acetyltransferase [Methylocaldum sp.]
MGARDETHTVGLRPLIIRHIGAVEPGAWNALTDGAYPFLRHEFLLALEENGCLGKHVGWIPYHLLVEDAEHGLVAALPMYLKLNSFGEFVFDWTWADAYERAGMDYYPKLVVAAPFTPATGPRLLIAPEWYSNGLAETVVELAIEAAHDAGVSSLHWLFTRDRVLLDSPRVLKRLGCQFHWANRGYRDFEDFLSGFTAKRRKEVKRERRQVRETGVELRRIRGDRVQPEIWRTVHQLYRSTFAKHGNYPVLTLEFFEAIAATIGEQILLVLAERCGRIVGAAFFLVGRDALYGRYWGCTEDVPALHFEACYYQGIEYCIEAGLHRFEPGAQGEHKVSRGFLPTETWSAHWMANVEFHGLIANFLERESRSVRAYMSELNAHSPFKIFDHADRSESF